MIRKITNFIISNKYLIAIIFLGLILRLFKVIELFMYSHDNDLAGWFVKDIVINHHLRLIGQETSTQGIFIGPIFYYLLVPFYLVSNMDPIGGIFLVLVLGLFTIYSFYFVFAKVFNKNVGLVASLIYAISFYTVANDHEVVPTMPVILWTVWFFYSLFLILKSKQKQGFLLLGFLLGIVWHLNMALILLTPLVIVSLFLSKSKLVFKSVFNGILAFIFMSIPLALFEIRHNFSQTKSLFVSLSTNQHDALTGFDKVKRVFYLAAKDLNGLLWGSSIKINFELTLFILLSLGLILLIKTSYKKLILILLGWFLLYFLFFSLYSKVVSEYYLNGLITFYIGILAISISYISLQKYGKLLSIFIIAIFSIWNINRIITQPLNKTGYIERKAVIEEIKRDSTERGFSCVSISYITDPGYDLGYRYFIWRSNLKTKKISNVVPVYSIVFPMKPVFKTDKSFGGIGLIYPNYQILNKDSIEKNCEGSDYTLENPMFGFTQ